MKLIEVVILVGSQCLSPIDVGVGVTEAAKVQCAVLIRQDPATEAVEIVPRTAATDPDVIAMLVKPSMIRAADDAAQPQETLADGSAKQRPRLRAANSDRTETSALSGRKMQARNAAAVAGRGKKTSARRTDICGSYKAVWYTNKQGRRKYRCVRAG